MTHQRRPPTKRKKKKYRKRRRRRKHIQKNGFVDTMDFKQEINRIKNGKWRPPTHRQINRNKFQEWHYTEGKTVKRKTKTIMWILLQNGILTSHIQTQLVELGFYVGIFVVVVVFMYMHTCLSINLSSSFILLSNERETTTKKIAKTCWTQLNANRSFLISTRGDEVIFDYLRIYMLDTYMYRVRALTRLIIVGALPSLCHTQTQIWKVKILFMFVRAQKSRVLLVAWQ